MKPKAVKAIRRCLDSPYIDIGPKLTEIKRHIRPGFSGLDATFAEPPETLESLIETLLPQPKKDRTRIVEWVNPLPAWPFDRGEILRIVRASPKNGSRTSVEAQILSNNVEWSEVLRFTFPQISLDSPWPEIIQSDTFKGYWNEQLRQYDEVAPVLGFLVKKLIVQTDYEYYSALFDELNNSPNPIAQIVSQQ